MKTFFYIITVTAIIILSLLLFRSCEKTESIKKEKQRYENNVEALNDSIRTYKNLADENSFEKLVTVMTKDELKIYNKPLYDKIVKEDGEIRTIIETEVIYVDNGTTTTTITQLDTNKYSADFDYTSLDSVLTIKGRSRFYAEIVKDSLGKNTIVIIPDTTFIDEAKAIIGLTIGTKESIDGKIEVFVTPDSKNITISKLNGAEIYIPKKEKTKFTLNVTLGYGTSVYNKQIVTAPSLNFGIGYNFLSF